VHTNKSLDVSRTKRKYYSVVADAELSIAAILVIQGKWICIGMLMGVLF
jgi:hypothetical protein